MILGRLGVHSFSLAVFVQGGVIDAKPGHRSGHTEVTRPTRPDPTAIGVGYGRACAGSGAGESGSPRSRRGLVRALREIGCTVPRKVFGYSYTDRNNPEHHPFLIIN